MGSVALPDPPEMAPRFDRDSSHTPIDVHNRENRESVVPQSNRRDSRRLLGPGRQDHGIRCSCNECATALFQARHAWHACGTQGGQIAPIDDNHRQVLTCGNVRCRRSKRSLGKPPKAGVASSNLAGGTTAFAQVRGYFLSSLPSSDSEDSAPGCPLGTQRPCSPGPEPPGQRRFP